MAEELGKLGGEDPTQQLRIWKYSEGVTNIHLYSLTPTRPSVHVWLPATNKIYYAALGSVAHPKATKGRVSYGGHAYAILTDKDTPIPSGYRDVSDSELGRGTITIPSLITKVIIRCKGVLMQGLPGDNTKVTTFNVSDIVMSVDAGATYTISEWASEMQNDSMSLIYPTRIEWSAYANNSNPVDTNNLGPYLLVKQ